jgi:hypothetical protein
MTALLRIFSIGTYFVSSWSGIFLFKRFCNAGCCSGEGHWGGGPMLLLSWFDMIMSLQKTITFEFAIAVDAEFEHVIKDLFEPPVYAFHIGHIGGTWRVIRFR